MSSSSEAHGTTGGTGVTGTALPPLPELRVGTWTRLGGASVLGDDVTESLLDGIAREARDAARAQGYAVGWAEGRRAAAEQAAEEGQRRVTLHAADEARREVEHRAAIDALGAAAEQVRGLLDDLASAIEEQAIDVAWALTTEVIGLRTAALGAPEVVARVLQVLPPAPVGRVRLHPSVVTSPAVQDLADRGLEVVADATLGRADAVVESTDGAITDLRIDEAMARVREVLA